ncbi:MAG: hypothetical protein ACPG32_09880 [Akkermansiaceae bacterium]
MLKHAHITAAITGVFLLGAAVPCAAQQGGGDAKLRQLERQLKKQQDQNHFLARELAAAKKREAGLRKDLDDLRLRFIAIGENLLEGGESAHLEHVKNAEVLAKRNRAIETASHNMMANLRDYLRTTVTSDLDARARLETSIRELDVALRLRQNPRPQIASGNLQNAKIKSIDTQSGLLVIDAGSDQSVRQGMTFTIMRGNRKIAEAICAEARKGFSGLLPTALENSQDPVRAGDIASVKTTQR